MSVRKDELLVRARSKDEKKFLDLIWKKYKEQGLVGRCWGGYYNGSTIVLGNSNGEIVVVSLDNNQQLQIKEFCLVDGGTDIGNEVRYLLEPLMS
jgi:hypothetical protein